MKETDTHTVGKAGTGRDHCPLMERQAPRANTACLFYTVKPRKFY